MTRYLSALSVAVVLLLGYVQPAQAAPIVFTDRVAWNQAVGNSTLIDFDQPTVCQQRPMDPATCVATYDGLVQFFFDQAGFPAPPGSPMQGAIPFGAGGQSVGTFLLQPVTAMGFDIIPVGAVRVLVNGQAYDLDHPQFFGFLFDSPVMGGLPIGGQPLFVSQPVGPGGQQVGQGGSVFALDNLSLQTVPEPATLLTFGIGASALFARRQRRRK